ncbi:histidine phosphatase family protein [Oceanobacter mangrovi]|uniref:histidine phosphatase family protein n=1 Tax=Oceanobacter mangrovi TaxID=2862510 RepID=UPI001C8E63E5|nr:histidine phosphatase family protein [Oceanobacter mangrovi]
MTDTRIDLIRHGRVDGPAAMYGSTDVPLHADGWLQLQQAATSVELPDLLISSPKQRCLHFARQFAEQQQLPLQVLDDLREYDFGDWDGIPFSQLFGDPQDNPAGWQRLQRFSEQPALYPVPGGETIDQVYERVTRVFQQLQQQHQGKHIMVFCHGAVIRLILASLLPVDWRSGDWFSRLSIAYGSRSRIRIPQHPYAFAQVECIGSLPPDVVHMAHPEGNS